MVISKVFLLKRIDELQTKINKGVSPYFLKITLSTLDLNMKLLNTLYEEKPREMYVQ
jgi:hypothetical protein